MALKWTVGTKDIDPAFLADITALLTDSPYAWAVTYGYRTYAEQAALYAAYEKGGCEAAPPGRSAHEAGLAVDLAWVTPAGGLSWDYSQPAWAWLWRAVAASPTLHSGHDFPPAAPSDDDHVESYRWAHSTSAGPSVIAQREAAGTWGKPPEAEA